MNLITTIYTLLLTLTTIALWIAAHRIINRDHARAKQMQYIRQITRLLLSDTAAERISARTRRERMALCKAIYFIVSHCYDCDTDKVRRVAEANRLERLLRGRLHFAHGARRAALLKLFCTIPLSEKSRLRMQRLMRSSDSDIRIAALIALIASNPSTAIRTLSALQYRLSPFDIARIISLLRRGVVPIAYEPLLADANPNLKMLGMAIVRSFGIEIAEKRLHTIIATEQDASLVNEALYTLSSLGRSLAHTRIRERLASMPTNERKNFCRHLSAEGYSLASVRNIFSEQECRYAETLINSYKRALVRTSV